MVFELIRIYTVVRERVEVGRYSERYGLAREAREFIRWTVKTFDRRAGKWQASDGLWAEVPLWCASETIARRRIDLVCLQADCKNGSECWKIATRGPVGRIL
jgi:hypothetical protein